MDDCGFGELSSFVHRQAATGEGAYRHQAEKLTIGIGVKDCAAAWAFGFGGNGLLAGMADPPTGQLVCNTGDAFCGIPELRGAGAAQDRFGGDLAAGDHCEDGFV